MALSPLFASPIKNPVAPSKLITQVAEDVIPILCSIDPQATAFLLSASPSAFGRNLGTINNEIPLVPAGASGSLAKTI